MIFSRQFVALVLTTRLHTITKTLTKIYKHTAVKSNASTASYLYLIREAKAYEKHYI